MGSSVNDVPLYHSRRAEDYRDLPSVHTQNSCTIPSRKAGPCSWASWVPPLPRHSALPSSHLWPPRAPPGSMPAAATLPGQERRLMPRPQWGPALSTHTSGSHSDTSHHRSQGAATCDKVPTLPPESLNALKHKPSTYRKPGISLGSKIPCKEVRQHFTWGTIQPDAGLSCRWDAALHLICPGCTLVRKASWCKETILHWWVTSISMLSEFNF